MREGDLTLFSWKIPTSNQKLTMPPRPKWHCTGNPTAPKKQNLPRPPGPFAPCPAAVPSFGPGDAEPTSSRRQRPCPAMPLAVGPAEPAPSLSAAGRGGLRASCRAGPFNVRRGPATAGAPRAAPPLPAASRSFPQIPAASRSPWGSREAGTPERCPTKPCQGAGDEALLPSSLWG